MKKKHKQNFIDEHGKEMWDLVYAYDNNGHRSPEAKEAWKLYKRFSQGLLTNEYSVYGIYNGSDLVYIGKTSTDPRQRWHVHKSFAKKLFNNATPLHHHMNEVGIDNFQMKVLEVFKTDLEAKLREMYLQDTLNPPMNKNRGGGGKSRLKEVKEVRPLTLSDNITIRSSDPDGFGFAVAKRS